jgi:hypothetical protein
VGRSCSKVLTTTPFPSGRANSNEERTLTGLTVEETIEFEAFAVLDPFDKSGNIAWTFEGEPTTLLEKRWLELYMKHVRARSLDK